MKHFLLFLLSILLFSCDEKKLETANSTPSQQYITVLGTAQDGGFPHIGCQRECCSNFYERKSPKQKVVSLGLVDMKARSYR